MDRERNPRARNAKTSKILERKFRRRLSEQSDFAFQRGGYHAQVGASFEESEKAETRFVRNNSDFLLRCGFDVRLIRYHQARTKGRRALNDQIVRARGQ